MSRQPGPDPATLHDLEGHHVSRWVRLRWTIMAGVTVIVPLWITFLALRKLFQWADSAPRPFIRQFALQLGYPEFHIPGLGFLLTFAIVLFAGTVATNVFGRRLLQSARDALERLPLVRTIYAPIQHLMDTMISPNKVGFKKVVMVEYPRRGTWGLGFVAGDVPGEDGAADRAYSVFVPTAPNPTTGFVLIVPVEEVRETGMSVEAMFQMMLSGGVALPPELVLPAPSAASGASESGAA